MQTDSAFSLSSDFHACHMHTSCVTVLISLCQTVLCWNTVQAAAVLRYAVNVSNFGVDTDDALG
jgi:hypothetical protein